MPPLVSSVIDVDNDAVETTVAKGKGKAKETKVVSNERIIYCSSLSKRRHRRNPL